MNIKTQIIATLGPSSGKEEMIASLVENGASAIRLNFSWGDLEEKRKWIDMVREVEKKLSRKVSIIADVPGPRIQEGMGHTYDVDTESSITEQDKAFIRFAVESAVDYVALSFVGSADDVVACKKIIAEHDSKTKVIAKIERRKAVQSIDPIIEAADALMIARGDLGNEIALETIPSIEADIIRKAKLAGKAVITATGLLFSMTEHTVPTRAEVTDVAYAVSLGSDALMLSDETASGKYPSESVVMMKKIISETEKRVSPDIHYHPL